MKKAFPCWEIRARAGQGPARTGHASAPQRAPNGSGRTTPKRRAPPRVSTARGPADRCQLTACKAVRTESHESFRIASVRATSERALSSASDAPLADPPPVTVRPRTVTAAHGPERHRRFRSRLRPGRSAIDLAQGAQLRWPVSCRKRGRQVPNGGSDRPAARRIDDRNSPSSCRCPT